MNILVTGGAGYIGSHTCVELLNSGYDVTVIDNLCNANPKSLERVEAITGRKVKFYEGDVRDEALLRKIFGENEISAVIHFAGLKAVGESVAQPWRYYDNNLNTTLVLTKVMADVGCKKIIFSSSATVYSGDNEMPLRETSRTGNCTNPYGWTKYRTEQILSGVRDYIHVVDLAKGHVAAVKYVVSGQGCEVFNLGTGIGYSVLDMVHAFEKANGVKVPYQIVGRRPGDLPTCYADPAKSERVLGWKAEKNLEDMCRDSWNWQSKNPMGYGE